MQLAMVVGRATATVKHASLAGHKLLLVQPLDVRGQPDGDPQLSLDSMGASRGDRVILTTDGSAVRDIVGNNNIPMRYIVIGIADR